MDVHYRLKMIPQAAGRRWEGSGNEILLQLLNSCPLFPSVAVIFTLIDKFKDATPIFHPSLEKVMCIDIDYQED